MYCMDGNYPSAGFILVPNVYHKQSKYLAELGFEPPPGMERGHKAGVRR